MVAKNPDNHLARFGLANEAMKLGLHAEAAEHLREYLARYDDEGNGWGRLAESLLALGRPDEARDAFRRGIEARLRAVEAEPAAAPDRERKLQLLRRQRASVVELSSKRETLAAQMESAQLVLQNLKLDLIKLRSKGVGAAIGEVSTATQEARVLSRDIAHALEAAAEVRGL